jgi:hypothetical protein
LKLSFNNGDEHLGRHGAPDLRLDCVLAVPQKLLDSQVLFVPFEKQLDLPAAFVQRGNGQGRQGCVDGQEGQSLHECWVSEPYTARMYGVVLRDVASVQCNGLVAYETAAPVQLGVVYSLGVHVVLPRVTKKTPA